MDFPIFHLDLFGNRLLIAVIAVTHVLINHTLAVGFIPLVSFLEYMGFRNRKQDPAGSKKWDEMAYKVMFVGFIITTSLGALTGVGIWLSASLVNPNAIGSLIRVFYGAWFTEWIIFCLEVVFIMLYFLLWKKSNSSEKAKKRHIIFGFSLSVFSWLTMAIIVAILGFMMDSGSWPSDRTFLSGFTNPLYLPQLYFRTPLAMTLGGSFALFLILFFVKKDNEIREKAITYTSFWVLIWLPVTAAGAFAYYIKIPAAMTGNLPVAVATQAFMKWYADVLYFLLGAIILTLIVALWGLLIPRKLPKAAMLIPIVSLLLFLGTFERVREFIRKPFVIGNYMYANSIRVDDYPLYQRDGILPYCTYVSVTDINSSNRIEAGKEVFRVACSRCHTITGLNSVVKKFRKLNAGQPLRKGPIVNYIPRMHKVWYFMPPFPGNAKELDALADFIIQMDKSPRFLEGAQSAGTPVAKLRASFAGLPKGGK